MAKRVKIVFTGFEELLEDIEKAGGEIKPAVETALQESINLIDADIRAGAVARGLGTAQMITPQVKWEHDKATAEAGFKLGNYDPDNPNDGYLALFKEYGTAQRSTADGENRGRITADPWIRQAQEQNAAQIKRTQKNALNKILGDLQK